MRVSVGESECHFEDFERHECAVNSGELAVDVRTEQRSKRSFLTTTVSTPKCVHTVWGKIQKASQKQARTHSFSAVVKA